MQRKITFFFLLAFAMLSYQTTLAQTRGVTITGNCFLEGQTNHSDVKVLFTAVSPSAVTTEVFTTSTGSFIAGLNEGIYQVEYSKTGFVTQTLPETYSFFANTTLPDVTLAEGFSGTMEVSGPQSGIWQSGYLVKAIDNISINAGDTLLIEPGVTIKFMGNFAFTIKGTLLSAGSEVDSIVFTSGQSSPAPNDWQYLKFIESTSSGSILAYSVLLYGYNGIYCISSSPTITHSRISNSSENGIICYTSSTPMILQNIITYNGIYGTDYDRAGIKCGSSSPIIKNNTISNNKINGIHCSGSSPIIQDNIIDKNYLAGIICTYSSSPTIKGNNIIKNGFGGNDFNRSGITCSYSSFPTIQNNTLRNNKVTGILCRNSSSPIIKNNIILKNTESGINSQLGCTPSIFNNILMENLRGVELYNTPQNLSYNLFWDNTAHGDGVPVSFGEIVTQNVKGDSCDTYFNLFMDPNLVAPVEGNYSWVVEGDSVRILIGSQPYWQTPYYVYVFDENNIWSGYIRMEWSGDFYFKKLKINFFEENPIYGVYISDRSAGGFQFYPDFINNPVGPIFSSGVFGIDFHPTANSPCIDAGNPAPAYFDPDGTVADIGAFYYDQGSAAPVISDFTATPVSGSKPLVVQFTQAITGPVTEYTWLFGDGATSNLPNPVHVYNTTGTYDVALMVTGPGGSDTKLKAGYIEVLTQQPPLNAAFSAIPLLGYSPLLVQFTNLSVQPWQTVLWDFGDGSTSTTKNPLHNYHSPGNYTVSLTVFASYGQKTETKTNYIQVLAMQQVVAMFDVSGNNGAAPYSVGFFNQSFGSVDSLSWNFGDDGTSTLTNPLHTFVNPGEYQVTLTAYGPLNTSTASETILVGSVAPIITQITDRPNDQGGYVYVEFKKSFYDNVIPGKSTESYTIQRQDNGHWVSLTSALAYGEAVYTIEAATLADSVAGDNRLTNFRVIAGMDEGTWISEPAQGYSTDNLAPEAPLVLDYTLGDEQLAFSWNQSQANDFDYFAIYKSTILC